MPGRTGGEVVKESLSEQESSPWAEEAEEGGEDGGPGRGEEDERRVIPAFPGLTKDAGRISFSLLRDASILGGFRCLWDGGGEMARARGPDCDAETFKDLSSGLE